MTNMTKLRLMRAFSVDHKKFITGITLLMSKRNYSSLWQDLQEDSETPILAENSWDEIWAGVLSVGDCGINDILHYNVEESIESWAAQSLPPLPSELSTETEICTVETAAITSPRETERNLCYGMVISVFIIFHCLVNIKLTLLFADLPSISPSDWNYAGY
jgi:hypothetical protein